MNLNYAIFRSQPIMTIQDLAQTKSHKVDLLLKLFLGSSFNSNLV